jgi:signal transduction histidine kinase
MIDHLKNGRSIYHVHLFWYALILGILMIMVTFVMSEYPQNVALIILVWISTLWSALSIWVFDSFFFWIPISSAIGTIGMTYFLLLGYQTNKIERKHYRLQQEQKYLQDLEQLKNNFVSLISHDLKTPIAKIQAILDRLMIREHSPELQADLRSLRQSNEELNRYIQSVLKMLRVESRDFKLYIEVSDINEVIQEVYKQLIPLAQEKNIFISMNLEPLFSTEFDQTLIREVVVNLVENAIKYTPNNGTIHLATKEDHNYIMVTVQDTGEGISETELENIWGKFVRGKNQDLKTKGTGLGLYLVKFFIELHGGEVWIESKIGTGTLVKFTIPVEQKASGDKNEYSS